MITLDEQLTLPACTYIVHNDWHNAFGNMVSLSFVDNLHVGFHQVPDGLHLSFQLRVHRAHVIFSLQYNKTPGFESSINNIQCNEKISISPLYSMSFKHSYSIYIQCRSHYKAEFVSTKPRVLFDSTKFCRDGNWYQYC